MIRALAATLVALPLAGCISFGAAPPDSLLTLTPTQTVESGRSIVAEQASTISVMVPSVPQALATQRVPVLAGATEIAYVEEAQWVEQPNRLFQRLLSEVIQARSGRAVLSPRQFELAPGVRVSGVLNQFGVVEAGQEAVVSYDATISQGEEGQPSRVATRRFESRVPVSAIEARSVGAALNQAANQVATEVSDWIIAGGR